MSTPQMAWGVSRPTTTTPKPTPSGLQEIMDQQLAVKIDSGETHSTPQVVLDDELAAAIAESLKEAQRAKEVEELNAVLARSMSEAIGQTEEDSDPDWVHVAPPEDDTPNSSSTTANSSSSTANSSSTTPPSSPPSEHKTTEAQVTDEDQDLALALQLQEEERLLHSEQQSSSAHASEYDGKVCVRPRFTFNANSYADERHGDDQDDVDEDFDDDDQMFAPVKTRGPFWATRDKTLKGQGGDRDIVTKHDPEINGRRNVQNMTNHFSTRTQTGDLAVLSGANASSRLKVSNRVFNSLNHNLRKQANAAKGLGSTVEKDFKQTYAKGLDMNTRLILHKMVNSSVLEEVNGVVQTGKEATVYHAHGTFEQDDEATGITPKVKGEKKKAKDAHPDNNQDDPHQPTVPPPISAFHVEIGDYAARHMDTEKKKQALAEYGLYDLDQDADREIAVKVFRTTLDGFKNRADYIEGDPRFSGVGRLKRQNPRKIVRVWAEKEFKNLVRIYRAGIPSPEPLRLHDNVLLMQFIGRGGWPAPQLKEASLSSKAMQQSYVQVVLMMRIMYQKANLVHADLSEFNILYFNGRCFMIDVGQSLERTSPDASRHLQRDCENVNAFFEKTGQVCPTSDLVELIMDKDLVDEVEDADDEGVEDAGDEGVEDAGDEKDAGDEEGADDERVKDETMGADDEGVKDDGVAVNPNATANPFPENPTSLWVDYVNAKLPWAKDELAFIRAVEAKLS